MSLANADDVEVGEHLSMHSYYIVNEKDDAYIYVTDAGGKDLRISRSVVDSSMTSTSQYSKEVKVTQTRISQLMETLGHAAFKVTFNKQANPTVIADSLDGKDLETKAKRRKVISQLLKGEERVLHGRLWLSRENDVEMELGRYKVVDFEHSTPGKPAQRLVDTRTVKEIIVEGTRYYT